MNQAHNDYDRREEFVSLLMRHERVIRAYVMSVVTDTADLDDVMQEVSIAAWRSYENLDAAENFRAWACGIARNYVLRFKRTKARNRIRLKENIEQLIVDEGFDELNKRQNELAALHVCVGKLPKEQKDIVFKAYAGSYSMKAIAEAVGKTPDAIYQIISRARKQILKCIEKTVAEAR